MERVCANALDLVRRSVLSSPVANASFVTTGDIHDMWIRDSTDEVRPLIGRGEYSTVASVLRMQAFYISTDAYANSFSRVRRPKHAQSPRQKRLHRWDWIATYNYELDSSAFFLRFMMDAWEETRLRRLLDWSADGLIAKATRNVLTTWSDETDHESKSTYRYVQLPRRGRGPPSRYTGMIWTGYRPSDDRSTYGYHIPANVFASTQLHRLADARLWNTTDEARQMASTIDAAVRRFGTKGGLYCYEVNGMGDCNLMDDANMPSLLGLPLLDPTFRVINRTAYKHTREFVLSGRNPYFFKGQGGSGVGSPHTPIDHVWPLALIIQYATSDNDSERRQMLAMLENHAIAHGGLLHESFSVKHGRRFTRPSFVWPNALLLTHVCNQN